MGFIQIIIQTLNWRCKQTLYFILFYFAKPYKILSQSLAQPREEYRVRDIDPTFASMLKKEILERANTFAKPLIANCKKMLQTEIRFDKSQIETLMLEVIGGNHRCETLVQLMKEVVVSAGRGTKEAENVSSHTAGTR